MSALLFLCHRLPWPPNKGDKIRAYHVLRRLAEHHDVYLGTFIDDPDDWQYADAVKAICAGTCIRPLSKGQTRRRAFASLLRGEALTLGCYRDRVLQRWVDALVDGRKVEQAVCYSSGVAPLVLRHDGLARTMDFVDADSDKWLQYARERRGLTRVIFGREARCLAAFEHEVAARFDASIFVSEAEAAFFRRQVPALAERIHGIPNGVDAEYWDPQLAYPDPYPPGQRTVAFVGAMDYRANVHAAQWFAQHVWPQILLRHPDARFYIVGSKPASEVRALGQQPGVAVTGRVDDVRPYVAHAHAVAAPLRIARGIQNKVLEALAMEKVVLATPEAWEGIPDFEGRQGCISDQPAAMAEAADRWLGFDAPARVPAARAHVRSHFDWARNLGVYEGVLRKPKDVSQAATARAAMEACP